MANATTGVGGTGGQTVAWGDEKIERPLAATAQTYYPKTMVALDSSDNATKCDDTAGLRFDGLNAETVNTTVFSGEAAGDRVLKVTRPFRFPMKIAAAAAGDVGKRLYAVFDNEVGYTSTNLMFVGWVDKVLSATEVLVKPAYSGTEAGAVGVASASGAITQKDGVLFITKAGVAAMTIADPTAGADDGKRLAIVSTTANAHTVTYATTGFNAGTTGTDVGTFGGAKGDNLVIRAYGGVWYVESKVNVTLA